MPTNHIIALELQPEGELDERQKAYFAKCEEKLGMVPNVLRAYAFNPVKLQAFTDMYNDLMLGDSGLSKLEREMIAVVVSSVNRCFYCLTAHGATVRLLSGDPKLGELMVMNWRVADLDARQRAMLAFAWKLTERPAEIVEDDRAGAARGRLLRPRHLGHRLGRRLLQHVEPGRRRDRHAAERRVPRHGPLSARPWAGCNMVSQA